MTSSYIMALFLSLWLRLCCAKFFAVKPDRDSEALDFRAASELLRRTLVDA